MYRVMYRVVYRVVHRLVVDTHNDTSPEHEFDEYYNATCVEHTCLVDLPKPRQQIIATDSGRDQSGSYGQRAELGSNVDIVGNRL